MNVGSISMVNFGDNRQAERNRFYGDTVDLSQKMNILYEKLDRIESNQDKHAKIITRNQSSMHKANEDGFVYMSKYSSLSAPTISYIFESGNPVNVIK